MGRREGAVVLPSSAFLPLTVANEPTYGASVERCKRQGWEEREVSYWSFNKVLSRKLHVLSILFI